MIYVLIGGALLLLVSGAPVYLWLGLPSLLHTLSTSTNPTFAVASTIYEAVNNSLLPTVPLYILMGALLVRSNLADYIVNFFDSLLGHFPGGLALVAVLASVFFAGISGISAADAAILALVLTEPMVKAGYDKKFVIGLLAAGGTLGIIIPPSVPMLLYAFITGESPGRLFIAGVLPGLFLGLLLATFSVIFSIRERYAVRPWTGWPRVWSTFRQSFPILLLPFLIVLLTYTGIATPTETASVAAVYAALIGWLLYRRLTLKDLWQATQETARLSSVLFLIVAASVLMGFTLIERQIPQTITRFVVDLHLQWWQFLVAINILMIILGIPLEPPPILFMTMPILYPILAPLGIDGAHFGIIVMVNLALAMISPPVGVNLFVLASIAKAPVADVFRGVIPFNIVVIAGLVVITYWPQLSLTLAGGVR
ncbi:MAG: TRAP transporter large permease [Chloroflexi bacterium]|nr:TRAP transporter large permease [Chloroflexota bacterium]